ncbi:hypothetical protein M569_10121 [Genlisea aurea]|uniref:Peptidase metallopeptidase domain-containing protein n=1 Tax=Genlisea aurea TaxID=192259 RepID=S8CJ11_9LAMI|nr:hypothetical protein M569_10121 [Genlisea aurea]
MKNRDELKRYFQRFGYLSSGNDSHELIESAIKRYQKTLGLSASGTLDRATVSEINAPRCGVPDVVTAPSRATERYVYFAGKPMWRRNIPMTLTYGFSRENTIASVGREQMRGAFRRAFARWAAVIPVNFEESDDYEFADIKIGFYSGDHGDGESFDGVLGVLAHAFSPESGRYL